ncbi:MAG: AAA family ATPase [Ilumatobacteraceae bacterium]|jgi:DNA-binding CsgD family transcriptional regulator|nr:AAA family ATPase [Ilumatobacteraceae bacterium]MBP7891145.1 AAA family ATPase [Ilumatobacteraceae bacterium]MBP8211420.1 AAA family ATPase [Ilumatobacteraceae bacterium]HRC49048.1 helix-turn-helix transcriptional regulator [Ilumatobacteraceae bacterium]
MHTALAQALDLAAPTRPRRVLWHGPRGAGKTWWLAAAEQAAAQRGFTVARVAGRAADRDLAFAGLASLFQPFPQVIDALGDDGAALRSALAYTGASVDPVAVKLATLRALAALAEPQPLCVLIDDVHLLDMSTRDVLDFALARSTADPIVAFLTAPSSTAIAADRTVRLEPLPVAEVAAILQQHGLAAAAGLRCAHAAAGNPGVAVAMADGLSEAQRTGRAPVPDLPRLAGELADELQLRMRDLGERCCRALVVAAADESGELGPIGAALRQLGEPGTDTIEPAEEAGIVEVIGSRVAFADPWMRHAAYHLLAPASRRAAHRALAAAYDEPHQASARVWHLVGAANGPSDSLAEALSLVAADAARRGAPSTAARTYERAAEFAATTAMREQALADAIGAALDGGELVDAVRMAAGVTATTGELAQAVSDVSELATGRSAIPPDADGATRSGARRRRRRSVWAAAAAGDHRAVLRLCDDSNPATTDVVPLAVALRHAGRARDARDLLARADAAALGRGTFIAHWMVVAQADLAVLSGRVDDLAELDLAATDEGLRAQGVAVAARARLVHDPVLDPAGEPAAWGDDTVGAVGEVRAALRSGHLHSDPDGLQAAIDLAEQASLPIEAGEARLWLASLLRAQGTVDVSAIVRLAQATLQRCGVRAWDPRCAALLAPPTAVGVVRAPDPAVAALSQAELRVVDAVAAGLTNREVAAKLFLSVKTVDFHLQQVYRKLGVRSRTELAVRMTGGGPTVGQGAQR